MNARDNTPQSTVESVLQDATVMMTVTELRQKTGLDEKGVRAQLRHLAWIGQIEHIPGRGRYDGRYGLISTKPEKVAQDTPKHDQAVAESVPVKDADQLQQDVAGLMSVIYDVRVAIGDPHGKIMLGELAERINDIASIGALAEAEAKSLREELAETKRGLAVLKERHDSYEKAIADIHRACADAGIAEGHVSGRVAKLAETVQTLRDTVHKITEGDDAAVDVLQAATGFVVLASKRKPRRIKKPEVAREAALSAIRAGAQRAGVFALVPVGEARRGAEWRDA